jgi:hypothetical protein
MGSKKPENEAHNNLFGGTLVKRNLILLLAALALAIGCQDKAPKSEEQPVREKPTVAQSAAGGFTGTALETMEADRYTYVQVDTGSEKIWAATPEFRGKVGDTVVVPKGLAMQNFHSKTLERDFEVVYFVGAITVAGNDQGPSQMAQTSFMHPPKSGKGSKSQTEVSGIKRAKDGKNVAEIIAGRKDLAGEQVTVRGKVVKFLPQIMGKNWLHLQDGSGSEGTNDLTVTTGTTVKVGDMVLVSGVVSVDRDFGYGYEYEVIIEDAEVTVE